MPRGVHNGHLRGLDHPVAKAWKPPCSESQLRAMYVDEFMSQEEIAAALGVTLKRVQTAMRRFGIPTRKQAKRDQAGAANASWKGDEASYTAVHARVERLRGKPQKCEECGTDDPEKRYEWANLTGDYFDPDDYARMCAKCHRGYDAARRREGVIIQCPRR